MTTDPARHARLRALELIRDAFAHRTCPDVLSDSKQLSDQEHAEVMSFDQLDWQAISFDLIERSSDAVFWFSPAAFCYFLPGFLSAGLRESRTDSNAYDALIGMLGRSPEPDYWDEFFLPRWTSLTTDEIGAVSAWVDWLAGSAFDLVDGSTVQRVQDTLLLLRWTVEEAKAE